MLETKEKWVEITLSAPVELCDALSNFMEELGTQGVSQEEPEESGFNDTLAADVAEEIKAYLPLNRETKNKIASLNTYIKNLSDLFPDLKTPSFTQKKIVDPDWGEQWKKYFKPLKIGRNIIIKPTWERYSPTSRDIVIDIDPGMAFGTGQHPSTRLCIIAIEDIALKNRNFDQWNVLDIGTGTGILAICAAKMGAKSVAAVDLDPKAVEIAGTNALINGVENSIDIINRDASMCEGIFELIIANLTASTLINLQSTIITLMKPGGYLVASGIIDRDAKNVEKLFQSEGVILNDIKSEEEWVSYVFKKGKAEH
ncbi:MAG: 50S ribosomal protein L11 methyltransferase [Deltaproteobacteria bacterium]|nr:50S ribosomal protein L11 methyltransferase [Deltaproteobacteria bacterium]